jgi:hypothetical protein
VETGAEPGSATLAAVVSPRALAAAVALVAAIAFAPAARAQPNGVPSIEGDWIGTLKATRFDLTAAGAVDPKQKFKGEVTVAITQTGGDLSLDVSFDPTFGGFASVTLEGTLGNFHLSMGNGLDDPPLVGSGKINRSATKITIRGVYASLDDTFELVMKLKRAP